MIKIEFPADDKVAASAFAAALQHIANGAALAFRDCKTGRTPEPGANHDEEEDDQQFEPQGETVPPDGIKDYAELNGATAESSTIPEGEYDASVLKGAPLDVHGVPFDEKYCSKAAEPFYATGKRSGQWKKRKGVSDETYDAWYASVDPRTSKAAEEPQVIDSSQAFTPQKQQAPAAPKDVGAFMTWVSEYQAAGALTQDKINAAWSEAGVRISDLFNAPPETVEQRIKTVYDILVTKL